MGKSNYTAAGAALLSESLSGGALVITRAVSGTGTADADLSEETEVSGETHDLKLLDIETVESNGETARRVKSRSPVQMKPTSCIRWAFTAD